jgi:hypothetical protein
MEKSMTDDAIVVSSKTTAPVRIQRTIVKVVATQNRRAIIASTKKAAKTPIKSSQGQRKTSLPYPQRVNTASLRVLERRGVTLQQLQNTTPAKSTSFSDIVRQGYKDHAARIVARTLATPPKAA